MKITLLGTMGAYPSKDSTTCSYLIEIGEEAILMDCGPGTIWSLSQILDPVKLTRVIVSHEHYDHSSDLGSLIYSSLINMNLGRKENKLKIYTNYKLKIEDFLISSVELLNYDEDTKLELNEYLSDKKGPNKMEISFFKTFHDIDCFGWILSYKGKKESIISCTSDTGYFDNLPLILKNSDYLIAECSLYKAQAGLLKYHMSTRDIIKLGNSINPEELILTHLPHFGDHEDLVKEVGEGFRGKVRLAKPYLQLEFN